jgi:hypothetical protein
MNLKLQLLANNESQTWTLKSTRGEYSIGTTPSCDIELTDMSVDVNLKLIYDQYSQIWYVSDLSNRGNLSIDNQPLKDYAIKSQSTITVDRGVTLTIIPEGSPASSTAQYAGGNTSTSFPQAPNNQPRAVSQTNNSRGLRKLTWAGYVDECNKRQGTARFNLITGLRYTPWVKAPGSIGFDAFDGYIIPDFKEIPGYEKSADAVVLAIQNKLSEMQANSQDTKYDNTNCYVVSLTDAHIIDTTTQSFLGIEFFPIRRGKNFKPDYRDFCVVSYNSVTAYLLVENYGSDLFVSWITRFEPRVLEQYGILIITGILGFIAGMVQQNFLIAIAPLIIVGSVYIGMPKFMLAMGIVPKPANARFLGICAGIIGIFLVAILMTILTIFRSGRLIDSVAVMFFITYSVLFSVFQAIAFFGSKFDRQSIPPLDLVDAKKLDDAVSKQVESVLKPMLERANYTSEQIGQMLTRTSLGRIQFRR